MKRFFVLFGAAFLLLTGTVQVQAQINRDVPVSQMFRMAEGIVRIAEPNQLADTLSIWGDISLPGKYMVPRGTYVSDLISYARGPLRVQSQETQLDWSRVRLDIAISRYTQDQGEQLVEFRYRYNEPVPEEMRYFRLENNDLVSVQASRRPVFIDYVRVIAPTLSVVLSTILLYDRFSGN